MSVQAIETSILPRQLGKKKERNSPLRSVLAGSTAGAVEIGKSKIPQCNMRLKLIMSATSYYLPC